MPMDIIGALTVTKSSIDILKSLRDIDRGVDEAEFKLKISEVISDLADARIALAETKEALASKDRDISRLTSELKAARSGDVCPICRNGELEVKSVRPHPVFGPTGAQEHHLSCNNPECGHQEDRLYRPG